jgi:hypothetical protein
MTGSAHSGGAALRGGARLPIVAHELTASLAAEILAEQGPLIERVAAEILAEEPALGSGGLLAFAPAVQAGFEPGPSLLIEDHSAIALAAQYSTDAIHAYRMLMLAGDGDVVAVPPPRQREFEAYCRDTLGLGRVDIVTPRATADVQPRCGLAELCWRDPALVARVAERARVAGRLTIIPYMGNGAVWKLASAIAERAGVPVRVAAPPPSLCRRVNDKAWFTRCATALLGQRAVPATYAAHGMAALAGHVAQMARTSATVAVKLLDSASSAGNLVLDSAELAGHGVAEIRDHLHALLAARGWHGEFPLLATIWESPLVATPSAQLWIPPAGAGLPVVEGVFDQSVAGKGARFTGATPTALDPARQRRIAAEALRMGLLFQRLGYVGRCSFDAIVLAASPPQGEHDVHWLHWVECNGRWGGVSIPMSLANRLDGRGALVIAGVHQLAVQPTVRAVFDAIGDALYRPDREAGPDRDQGGAIVLSPGFVHSRGRLEFMALGASLDQARNLAQAVARRLGPDGHADHPRPRSTPATRPRRQ